MTLHLIVYYIGLVLGVGGFVSLPIFLYKLKKKENDFTNLKDFFLSKKLYLIGSIVAFILGFNLLNGAFFLNPNNLAYLEEAGITSVAWYHNILIYGLGTLFAISLVSLILSLYTCLYLQKFNVNKKHRRIWFTISLLAVIGTFYGYSEGLAPYLMYPLANAIYIGLQGIQVINIWNQGKHYTDGLTVYLYAIFILSGACLVLYVCDYKIRKKYGKHDLITNTFLVGFPSGIIGARIWYVCLDLFKSGTDSIFYGAGWVNVFSFRDGGMAIMGGAVLGIIAGVSQILFMKYVKKDPDYIRLNYLDLVDIIVPSILFAQSIGRIGNFFNNEVYGDFVNMGPWEFLPSFIKNNMYYQHGSLISGALEAKELGQFALPLFFIEFCTNLAGYFIMEYLFKTNLIFKPFNALINKFRKEENISKNANILEHCEGSLLGGYLLWYGLTRAFLEGLRNGTDFFRASEVTSYVLIALGLVIIIFFIVNNYVFKKKELLWYGNKNKNTQQ